MIFWVTCNTETFLCQRIWKDLIMLKEIIRHVMYRNWCKAIKINNGKSLQSQFYPSHCSNSQLQSKFFRKLHLTINKFARQLSIIIIWLLITSWFSLQKTRKGIVQTSNQTITNKKKKQLPANCTLDDNVLCW